MSSGWRAWICEDVIHTRRVYDEPTDEEDARFLVDRLWPRGISKKDLGAVWLKEVAPSDDLRRRFHGSPERWDEFRERYFEELESRRDALGPLVEAANEGDVVLIYASKDTQRNNAVALKEYLEQRVGL